MINKMQIDINKDNDFNGLCNLSENLRESLTPDQVAEVVICKTTLGKLVEYDYHRSFKNNLIESRKRTEVKNKKTNKIRRV